MAKNKHITVFFALIFLLFVFFMWMFGWLKDNSPTKELGALEPQSQSTSPPQARAR